MVEPAVVGEEELSPEEKLLRVIQGGDGKEKDQAAADVQPAVQADSAQSEPEPEPGPEMAVPEVKPKLKLATKSEIRAAGAPAPGEEVAEALPEEAPAPDSGKKDRGRKGRSDKKRERKKEAGGRKVTNQPAAALATTAGAAAMDMWKRQRTEVGTGIRIANRCLLIAIIILICLSGFEIWSGALATTTTLPPDGGAVFAGTENVFELPDVTLLKQAFKSKRIWDEGEEEPGPGPKPPPKPPAGPQAEKVLKLIGLSAPPGSPPERTTAVILDNRDGKMYFLKMGEKLPFNGHEFDVKSVFPDRVVLAEDELEVTIR